MCSMPLATVGEWIQILYGYFAAVCVSPWWIGLAASRLGGSPVKVATTIGFPLGANHTTVKRFEAEEATRLGAQELYDSYRAAGLTFEDVERGRYVRIRHIQRLQEQGQLDSSLRWSRQPAETAVVA